MDKFNREHLELGLKRHAIGFIEGAITDQELEVTLLKT